MDIYFYRLERNCGSICKVLYVDCWSLVLDVLSNLQDVDDSVVITRCKLITENANS